jgi:2-haloacid dehalogenase
MPAPEAIVFDVNETLLSLEPIAEGLVPIFGTDPPVGEWFARLLHGSLLANTLDAHRPFGAIAVEALVGVAARRGIQLSIDDARELLAPMSLLPTHPDVLPGIRRLAGSGIPMAALTNGSADVATSQIRNAGLDSFLTRVISVEEVGRFKPDPAPYLHAAEVMGVPIGQMMLVAAHDWDCAGAMAVGAMAVFVERPGSVWSLPSPQPGLTVEDIVDLSERMG